jgi:hypothetical protein
MTYGVDRCRALLSSQTLTAKVLPLQRVETFLDRSKSPAEWGMEWRAYIVSFCAVADTALQWLHYGHNGSGVAIGFDAELIEVKPFDLFPVLYDMGQQDALLRDILVTIDDLLVKLVPTVPPQDRDLLVLMASDLAANHVWMVAPRMKHPAFKGEQEWRLVTYEPRGKGVPPGFGVNMPVDFRTVAGRVVPYKKFKFEKLPALEIVLGASSPIQDNDQALAVLMEESIATHLPVSRSSVTVRP